MKLSLVSLAIIGSFLISGCAKTRSISNAHYEAPSSSAVGPEVFAYRGELSEFDVLGIAPGSAASDGEIERALAAAKRVRLQPNCSILLIQSGTMYPDGPMVAELEKHFRVVPFSGLTPTSPWKRTGEFERSDTE